LFLTGFIFWLFHCDSTGGGASESTREMRKLCRFSMDERLLRFRFSSLKIRWSVNGHKVPVFCFSFVSWYCATALDRLFITSFAFYCRCLLSRTTMALFLYSLLPHFYRSVWAQNVKILTTFLVGVWLVFCQKKTNHLAYNCAWKAKPYYVSVLLLFVPTNM
jgi:hypothetical protein